MANIIDQIVFDDEQPKQKSNIIDQIVFDDEPASQVTPAPALNEKKPQDDESWLGQAWDFAKGAGSFVGNTVKGALLHPVDSATSAVAGFQQAAGGMFEAGGVIARGWQVDNALRRSKQVKMILNDPSFQQKLAAMENNPNAQPFVDNRYGLIDPDKNRDTGGFWAYVAQNENPDLQQYNQENWAEKAGKSAKKSAENIRLGLDADFVGSPSDITFGGLGGTLAGMGGRYLTVPMTALQMADQQIEDRRQTMTEKGLKSDIVGDYEAGLGGMLLAPTEFIPMFDAVKKAKRLLGKTGDEALDEAAKNLTKTGKIKQYSKDILKQGLEEGLTEFAQGVGQNVLAKEVLGYDQARDIFGGDLSQQAYAGMTAGALFQAMLGLPVFLQKSKPSNVPPTTENLNTTQRSDIGGLNTDDELLHEAYNQTQQAGQIQDTNQAVNLDLGDQSDLPLITPEQQQQVGWGLSPDVGRQPSPANNEQSQGIIDSTQEQPSTGAIAQQTPEQINTAPQPKVGGLAGLAQQVQSNQRVEPAQTAPEQTQPNTQTQGSQQASQSTLNKQTTQSQPVVLQNRDRSTAASIAQMNEIASNPDYLRTSQSRSMSQGAPVVFGDTANMALGRQEIITDEQGKRVPVQYAVTDAANIITSHNVDGSSNASYETGEAGKVRAVAGNGRAAGITSAYQRGTAQNYKQEMIDDAANLGLDANAIAQMAQPVLVRVMPESEVSANIGDRSNIQSSASLSPTEQANNDVNRIDINSLQFDDNGHLSADSVMDFIRAMPVSEQGALLNHDGTPTRQAYDRVMAATFKSAYGNDALTSLYAQATDSEARNIISALAQSAGALSQLAGKGDYDIRSLISEAAIAAVNARRQGRSLKEYAKTQDFTVDPDVVAIIDFFADNIRSAKRIGEGLSKLANAFLRQVNILEQNKQQSGLFGEQPVRSREQLLEGFKRDTRQQATIQQQDRGEHTGQDATRPASGREGTAIFERPENQERQKQPERTQEVNQAPSNDGVFFGKSDGTAYKKEGEAKLAQKGRRDLKGKNTRVVKRDDGWWIKEVADNDFNLTEQTEAELAAKEAKRKADELAQAKVKEEQEQKAAQDAERKAVKQHNEKANEEFTLGQDAQDNLSGQRSLLDTVNEAASEVDTKPSDAQIEAGNYKKGHVSIQGLDITLENPKGSTRSGTDKGGKHWSVTMKNHYGYIKKTEGADGDHVDVFIGNNPESKKVFVVDQINQKDGKFDEHKVMLGFDNKIQAVNAYKANYSKDWKVGKVASMSLDDFKTWLKDGNTTKPISPAKNTHNDKQTDSSRTDAKQTSNEPTNLPENPNNSSEASPNARNQSKDSVAQKTNPSQLNAIADIPDSLIASRKPSDWPEAVTGWRVVGGGKTVPGYSSKKSAQIEINKNSQWRQSSPKIVPFEYNDGSLYGDYGIRRIKELGESASHTRYAIVIKDGAAVNTQTAEHEKLPDSAPIEERAAESLENELRKAKSEHSTTEGERKLRKMRQNIFDAEDLIPAATDGDQAAIDKIDALGFADTAKLLRDHSSEDKPSANKAVEPEPKGQPAAPIEDFGEKIAGARKDYASKLKGAQDLDIATNPFAKVWPEPNYQKLLDGGMKPEHVALIRAIRDEIPAKPRHAWKLKQWVKQVQTLRESVTIIMGDPDSASELAKRIESSGVVNGIAGRASLYEALGHEESLKDYSLKAGSYGTFNGVRYSPNKTFWTVSKEGKGGRFESILASGETKAEALADYLAKRKTAASKAASATKGTTFDIYTDRYTKDVFIGKKIGKNVARIKTGFVTVKEARQYKTDHQAELEEMLAKLKDVPNERNETNAPRVGIDHRNGANVTPEQFGETFGFRGVQFGNSVEQKRRQQDLNDAYDGLMDLAGILNLPPKALSLNGELALAFGARGIGGKHPFKAHYEPGEVVINLTKGNGAGSLAHEWWHALDNYFAKDRNGGKAPDSYGTEFGYHSSTRPEMKEAFAAIASAVNRAGIKARSQKLDTTRTKAYWSTGREMTARAFESYVIEKLRDQNQSNDYLANIVSEDYWNAAAALGVEKDSTYPYPEAAELPEIRAAYEAFFQTIEHKETDDGNVILFSRKQATKDAYESRIDALFGGDKPRYNGVKILDRADILDLLGLGNKPLHLVESAVQKKENGEVKHKGMTAEQWKKVPEWIENPVAVFRSQTGRDKGRLVLFAPELVAGRPVRIILEPNSQMGGMDVHVAVNAYEEGGTGKTPVQLWTKKGDLLYLDQKKSPTFNERSGLQLPSEVRQLRGYAHRIQTESDLVKYREKNAANTPLLSNNKQSLSASKGQRHENTAIPRNLPTKKTGASNLVMFKFNGWLNRLGSKERVKFEEVNRTSLPNTLVSALAALESFTKTEIHVLRNLTPKVQSFNGLTFRDGHIYVDETAQAPVTTIAAHEFVHNLRKTAPDLYAKLANEVERQGLLPEWTQELGRRSQGETVNADLALEELTADAVGDALTDPAFLQRMAERNPAGFKALAKRLIDYLNQLLGSVRNLGSNRYLTDVEAFRDTLADVLDEFNQLTSQQAAKASVVQALFQRAFHGTPHHGIEKTGFKLNKIGTGEGAQAYGWGIYFASNHAIAETYRAGLSKSIDHLVNQELKDKQREINSLQAKVNQAQSIVDRKGTWVSRNDNGLMVAQSLTEKAGYVFEPYSKSKMTQAKNTLAKASEQLAQVQEELAQMQVQHEQNARIARGQTYQAEIPEDSELLDWDAPLNEQPTSVIEKLGNIVDLLNEERGTSQSKHPDLKTHGSSIYSFISRTLGGAKQASEYLRKIGIPGLRYEGADSSNYVIWDESLLTPEAAQITPLYSRNIDNSDKATYDKGNKEALKRGKEILESRLEQWYPAVKFDDSGSSSLVSQEWAEPSRYASGRGDTSFVASEKAGREEQAKLIEAAKKGGFFFDDKHPIFAALKEYKNEGGAEHDAYIAGESPNQVVIRATIKGSFGNTSTHSPVTYLKRLEDYNQTFPELQIRLLGVGQREDGTAVVWTAQSFVQGEEFKKQTELDAAMRKKGWFEVGTNSHKYQHKETGAVIEDVHKGNVLHIGDELFPIDVIVEKLPHIESPLLSEAQTGFFNEDIEPLTQQDVIDAVTDAIGERLAKSVQVVQSESDLPKDLIPIENDGVTEGMYDPTTKKIYLVADNLPNVDRAVWVAFHELFHKGLRNSKLGQDYKTILERAKQNKVVERIARAIMRERGIKDIDLAVEEALAELNAADETGSFASMEKRYGVKVVPVLAAGIRKHINRLANFVRKLLYRLAGKVYVGDTELWNTIRGVRDGYFAPTFDAVGSRINYGLASVRQTQQNMTNGLPEAPEESGFRAIQRKLQDNFNRFNVVQKWLKDNNVQLSTGAKVYEAETRMSGRIATQLEDFREKTLSPLIKSVAKAGKTMVQVEELLHAMHAEERNKHIASINKAYPDGGSGMTNAKADAILKKYANDTVLHKLADKFRDISKQRLKMLVDAGIYSQDDADNMEQSYEYYVPLKGGEDAQYFNGVGKGLAAKKDIKRALGHDQREDGESIIENMAKDFERAIALTEKNRMAKHLLQMALEIKNPDLISINQPEKRGTLRNKVAYAVWNNGNILGAFTSQSDANNFIAVNQHIIGNNAIVQKTTDQSVVYAASPQLAPNETVVFVDGEQIRIQLNDELLARAWNNLGQNNVIGMLQVFAGFNRWLSHVYTGYSPDFFLKNIIRDFSAGFGNLTGEEGFKIAAGAAINYFSAIKQLAKYYRTGNASPMLQDYRDAGGKTGGTWLSDLESIGDDVGRAYNDAVRLSDVYHGKGKRAVVASATRRMFNPLLNYIESFNAVSENAFRMATYQTMIEHGRSKEDAAYRAKTITVNFSKRGEWGSTLNAIFLFFNAATQGTAAYAHAMTQGAHKKQLWALTAGLTSIAFMMAQAGFGGDDDDEDKLRDFDLDHNIPIKTSNGWIMIPLPYEASFFWSLGRRMSQLYSGDISVQDAAMKLAYSFASSYSTFGDVIQDGKLDGANLFALLPTAMQIAGGPIMNRNSFGGQIYPENPFDKGQPDSQKMYLNTKGSIFEIVTSALNEATGGDAATAGAISISPETLKYLNSALTGGTGRFIYDAINIPVMLAQSVALSDLNSSEIPLARVLYKSETIKEQRNKFYTETENLKEALANFSRAKSVVKNQARYTGKADFELIKKYGTDVSKLLGAAKYAEAIRKLASDKREAQAVILSNKNKSLVVRRMQAQQLEKEEKALYDDFFEWMKQKQ